MRQLFALAMVLAVAVATCGGSAEVTTTVAATQELYAELGVEVESTSPPTTDNTIDDSVPQESTTIPPDGTPDGMTYIGVQLVPEILEDFGFSRGWLDTEELFVAVASTSEQRRQGLMHVTDLATLSGMVFVFEQDSTGGFWMKDTLIPLDIAFFDSDGRFVDGFTMEPCITADCPTYRPSGSYRYALEMRAGDMHSDPQVLVLGDQP